MSAISAVKVATTSAGAAESGEDDQDRLRVRLQAWLLVCLVPAFMIYIFLIRDVWDLAHTFPAWGVLALTVYVLPVWVAIRFFFLNSDDVADYTLDAGMRSKIDVKWSRQQRQKKLLLYELGAWFAMLLIAVLWMMSLARLGLGSFFHFLN
jgi:hypothetical protein